MAFLKFLAICGDTLCLSDIQQFDSILILELFADKEFRGFVQNDPSFMVLTGPPPKLNGAPVADDVAVPLSGAARALQPGWLSSAFPTPAFSNAVAETVTSARTRTSLTDLFRKPTLLDMVKQLPEEHQLRGKGLVECLRYFTVGVGQNERVLDVKPPTYFEMLERLESIAKGPALSDIQDVIGFVNSPGNSKHFRSAAATLLRDDPAPTSRKRWLNIIQAWNLSVAAVVRPDYESCYVFRETPVLPTYMGELADVTMNLQDKELFEIERLLWHPEDLTWGDVLAVRKRLREAVPYPDNPLLIVSKTLVERRRSAVSPWVYVSLERGRCAAPFIGAFVGDAIGGGLTSRLASAISSPVVVDGVRRIVESCDRVALDAILRKYATRYNIRRS